MDNDSPFNPYEPTHDPKGMAPLTNAWDMLQKKTFKLEKSTQS